MNEDTYYPDYSKNPDFRDEATFGIFDLNNKIILDHTITQDQLNNGQYIIREFGKENNVTPHFYLIGKNEEIIIEIYSSKYISGKLSNNQIKNLDYLLKQFKYPNISYWDLIASYWDMSYETNLCNKINQPNYSKLI